MRKANNYILLFLFILIISVYCTTLNNENNITSQNNKYLTQQNNKTIYIISGNESSTLGDGTESNPYQSIEYAIKKANNGDTIYLLENVEYRQPAANVNFIINKNITIDGGSHTLSFRGSNLELLSDVEFKNLTLNMIPDGAGTTKIYASGNEVTFNNVSTLISQAQSSERPTIIGGSAPGSTSGTHTKINIINGSSETRFKEIISGKEDGNSSIPVTIKISSEYAKVDKGINLGGSNNNKVTGNINLTTNSKNIKKINGTNSTNNTITITDSNIYNIELSNIKNLVLKNEAEITPTNFSGITGDLTLSSGTSLWINTFGEVSINNVKGPGNLIISTDSNLLIKGNIVDSSNIKLNGFESDLIRNLNKIYIEVLGTINQNTNISLYNENEYYMLNKEGNKYRLIENNGFDKNNLIKIEVIEKPTKLSYIVGDTININNLLLKLTDNKNNTIIVDYTNLNDYNITYTPTSKLTINDKTLTIKKDNIKTTIPIVVKEIESNKNLSEQYTPTIKEQHIKANEKIIAKDFITNIDKLPKDTKYSFEKEPDFNKKGKQSIIVIVTYKDNSKDILSSTLLIENTPQKDESTKEDISTEETPEEEQTNPENPNEETIIEEEKEPEEQEKIIEEEQPKKENQTNLKLPIIVISILLIIFTTIITAILLKKNKSKISNNKENML